MKGKFKVFGIVFGLLVSSIPATGVTESKTAQADSNTVTGVRIEFDSNQDISDFWTGLNKTFKLNAVVEPSYAPNKRVTWSSSNPDVVTVDKYGNLFSVGYGYSYITVCTEDGGFTSRLLMKINGFGFNYGDTSCNCLYEADDLADMTKAVSGDTALFSEYQKKAMDLDGDGKITENDLDLMTKAVLGDAPKDSNGVTIFPVEKLINNISVKKLPDKTEYIVGEELDLTGLEVQVQYNSGITKVITDGFTFTGNTDTVGEQPVNITYYEDGIEKTTQFNIKVTDNEPTSRPIINQSPTPRPIVNQPSTPKPIICQSPIPKPDRTPEPVLEATGTPEPEHTSEAGFKEEETPSPEPEYTEKPSGTPEDKIEIAVTPLEVNADAKGEFYDNRVDISVKGAVSYDVGIKNSSWLKISKRNSSEEASEKITFTEKDSNSFYIFADKNTSTDSRTGNIIITAYNGEKTETKSIKIKQEAANTKLSVSVSKITANAKGNTSVSSVNIKTDGTGGFSADNCGYSWIKIGRSSSSESASSNVSFKSDGTLCIFISENTSDAARSGKIKITHEDGNTEKIISVNQEGRKTILEVDTESKTSDNKGSFYNNKIFVKTSGTGSFTAKVEDAEWLKLSSGSTSSFIDGMSEITIDKDSYIYLYADKNTGDERNAVITITHESGKVTKEITVNQLGKDKAYLNVDRESAYFDEPGKGISGIVTVSADDSTKWTVASDSDWIKVIESNTTNAEGYSSVEGTGNGTFYIMVKENNTYNERYGYVTISSPGLEDYEIYVYQVENEISIKSLLEEVSVIVTKKTFKKGKTSKIKLDYPEGLYESDIKSIKFSSNKKKVATVSKKGVIKGIKKGKAVITIKIILEDGSSKTFKAKITVDKRKVKLSKFK